MKTFLVAMVVVAAIAVGCSSVKPLQMEIVRAELIKIDTVFRQQNEKKLLTWRDQDNIEYVTFMPMNQSFPLGVSMLVMRSR